MIFSPTNNTVCKTILPVIDLDGNEQVLGKIDREKLGYPSTLIISVAFNGHDGDGGTDGTFTIKESDSDGDYEPVGKLWIHSNLKRKNLTSEDGVLSIKYKKEQIDSLEQRNIDFYYNGRKRWVQLSINHYNGTGDAIVTFIGFYSKKEQFK